MAAPVPSKQALQHLSRLCRNPKLTPTTSPSSRRALCTPLYTSNRILQHKKYRPTPEKNTRTFTSSSPACVQPAPSPETDPQNSATPTLPDITNYYTLFPSTLPSGPPGPLAREQSPASSNTPSNSTPSTAQFTIHLPTLRKEFLRLQSQHHPDKYSTGSPAHQKALALSALINNAYKTLSDPLLRAQYLLQLLYDVDVTSEDNAAHPTDQETLLEVMEAQERVEEATTQEEVDEIMEENTRRLVDTEKVMGEAFERGDVQEAKEECVRLKYWRSLHGALNEWEPGKEVRLIH